MSIPGQLLVHTASVEPYEGSGAYGDVYAAAVADVPCYFEQVRRLVRDPNGDEAVSEATVYLDPAGTPFVHADGTPGTVPEVPAGSRVTVNGYASTVITVSVLDDGGLTGLAHQEIALA